MWFKKKTTFRLRNQNEEIQVCQEKDILRFLELVFYDSNEFIVLEPSQKIKDVAFIQAVQYQNDIEVEVSIKGELYYKYFDQAQCQQIFMDFFHHKQIPDLKDFQPVQWM